MKIVAVVLLVVIAAALLWISGELHLQNCIEQAKAAEADAASTRDDVDELARELDDEPTSFARDLEACSRLPF